MPEIISVTTERDLVKKQLKKDKSPNSPDVILVGVKIDSPWINSNNIDIAFVKETDDAAIVEFLKQVGDEEIADSTSLTFSVSAGDEAELGRYRVKLTKHDPGDQILYSGIEDGTINVVSG